MEEPQERAEAVMENDFEAQEDANYNANQRPFKTFASSGKDLVQEFVTSPKEDGSSIKEALGNEKILHRIFSHLQTGPLLSPCSLVNKFWNTQARKFIRDHRSCTVKKNKETSACEFLLQLDQLCGQMAHHRRVVPFNGLKIKFDWICPKRSRSSTAKILYSNLISELKLRSLEVSGLNSATKSDCKHHQPLVILFQHKNNELQTLRLKTGGAFSFDSFGPGDEFPHFPQLEEFDINYFYFWGDQKPQLKNLRWLLKDTPNLKRVVVGSLQRLGFVPPEILARVEVHGRLDTSVRYKQDLDLLCTIAQTGCAIKELCIDDAPKSLEEKEADFWNWDWENNSDELDDDEESEDYDEDSESEEHDEELEYEQYDEDSESEYEESDEEDWEDPLLRPKSVKMQKKAKLRRRYHKALEQMLKTCHESLQAIEIASSYPLSQLSHPPLVNVSMLILPLKLPKAWNNIASMDFDRAMPKLQEVKISIDFAPLDGNVRYGSTTVRTLNVVLHTGYFDVNLLQALFPNVTMLNLLMKSDWLNEGYYEPPLAQLCGNWPDLEEMKITVAPYGIEDNYDAEFCGIHMDEVELLRRQDDEYLRHVHIVPSKPCLLTVPKLREFRLIEHLSSEFEDYPYPIKEHPDKFVSKVAKFIVFDRMPQLNACLPKFI